jgi:hypothetical protein
MRNKRLENKLPPLIKCLFKGWILNPNFKSLFDTRPKKNTKKQYEQQRTNGSRMAVG